MKIKIYSKLIILLALVLCLAACDGAVHLPGMVKISLNETEISINLGDTKTLIATITPDSVKDSPITWTSNDTTIATVDNNGLVTGKAAGEATITATITVGQVEYSTSCKVTINVKYVTITFDGNGATAGTPMEPINLIAGTTIALPANTYVYPDPGHDDQVFDGWGLTPDGGAVYADESNITPEDNITLFAQWHQLR